MTDNDDDDSEATTRRAEHRPDGIVGNGASASAEPANTGTNLASLFD